MVGEFEGKNWISATGYYGGHFLRYWIGIAPTKTLSYLRYGEFHHMQDDKVIENYIFLDMPNMIVTDQWPLNMGPGHSRGYTGLIQGPASQDGILTGLDDPAEGQKSYDIVTNMLTKIGNKR